MRNRVRASLVQDERAVLNHTDYFNMKSLKNFYQDMAVVTTRKTKLNWVKPIIGGAPFLDLSEAFMFRFHYEKMKQWFRRWKSFFGWKHKVKYSIQTKGMCNFISY